MRLTDASVEIRPREAWEAVDLGVRMAARQRRLLTISWLALTVPFFVVLTLLLWRWPIVATLALWWLKPAFDRLPLFILSKSLFETPPSVKQALKAWPKQARPHLFASLTWRRFSASRSFYMPALQLEGLRGTALSQRLSVLGQRDSRPANVWTWTGMCLELVFLASLLTVVYLFIPQEIEVDTSSLQALLNKDPSYLWFYHLTNLCYVLVLSFWEPIYVAGGFSLYLNRRTLLEAWDIELVLRRLRQRLTGSAYALLLVAALFALPGAPSVWAAEGNSSCPVPNENLAGPKNPRLLNQSLTSEASRKEITQLLDNPPFASRSTQTRWRFSEPDQAKKDKNKNDKPPAWLSDFFKHLDDMPALRLLAQSLGVLLWSVVAAVVVIVLWRYREWLATFVTRGKSKGERKRRTTPQQLFGMDVSPVSLPDDIVGTAEGLWAAHPREALSLLYRGLLSRLLEDFALPLKSSHTESEIIEQVKTLDKSALIDLSQRLTGHWQNLAYGHRLPPATAQTELCQAWRTVFENAPTHARGTA